VLVVDEVPAPRPRVGEILVDVMAASVNPVDCKIRAGTQAITVRWTLPHTIGLDAAGIVREVGPGVVGFAPGDAVFASPDHHTEGTCAEQVTIPAHEAGAVPRGLTWLEAASLPLVALTAWDALVTTGRIGPGTRVLVLGASGGVGTVAVQIARAHEAVVTATCSPRNAALVRELGADVVHDYRALDARTLSEQDLVLDSVGAGAWRVALTGRGALRRGGLIVRIVADVPSWVERFGLWPGTLLAWLALGWFFAWCRLRGRRGAFVLRSPSSSSLAAISALVEDGRVRPVIDRVFAFEDVADAHRYSEAGHARGKIVIAVRPGAEQVARHPA
jgi:NADPH:quinone reductase-like Zn-dependent oxidoreductase